MPGVKVKSVNCRKCGQIKLPNENKVSHFCNKCLSQYLVSMKAVENK